MSVSKEVSKEEVVKESINLTDRVEVVLIKDIPSMRKSKGDKMKTHPKNVANLVKLGYVAKK